MPMNSAGAADGQHQYTALSRVNEASPLSEEHTGDVSVQMAQIQTKLEQLLAVVTQLQNIKADEQVKSPRTKNRRGGHLPGPLSKQLSSNSTVGVSSTIDAVHGRAATGAAQGSAFESSAEAQRHGEEQHAAEQGPEPGVGRQSNIWSSQRVAVMISVIAGLLAWADMRQGHWKTTYMTHHTNMIDRWSFFQAKVVRSSINRAEFWILSALRNGTTVRDTDLDLSALDMEIARARFDKNVLLNEPGGDGADQLFCAAKAMQGMRDAALEHYESYEAVVTVLQVMIVLASTSVITKQYCLASIALVGTVAVASLMAYRLLTKDTIAESYVENDERLQLECGLHSS